MATNNIKDFRFSIYINNDAARKSLIEMEQLSNKYTSALEEMANAGKKNSLEYSQTKTKLDQVRQSMMEMSKQAGISSLNLTQLTSLKKALNYEFSKAIPGTENWNKLKTDITQVNTRIAQLRISNAQTGLSIGKIADSMNRYIGMIGVAAASLTGMVMGIRKTIDAYAQWDDKLADVMKTTGLTKDQVRSLNSELGKINTRTSQMELLDLARVAGKLGISGQKDVAGFVRAANQIKVALTEDLGGDVEESVNQLGKLTEIFKLKQEFGTEQALLKVGSAINSLGAASTANEGYMVEFAKRVAGVAPQADISIQKVLGLAATLDQLGQTSEVSSTVFAAVIPDMFKDTGKYAQIAGMGVDEFAKLLKVDANQAFIAFLNGLNGNNAGLGEMATKLDGLGLEGKRSISVLGVLAANTDLLRQQQQLANVEFARGTSLTQEYNTKNNNAQAELEKARKGFQAMAVELGEKLAPAMTFSTNGMSYFLNALKTTIEFASSHIATITSLSVAIAAYTIVVKAKSLATKLSIDWDILSLKYLYAKDTAIKVLSFSKGVLTGKITLLTAAQKAWNLVTSMSLGGVGLLVSAIAGATAYFIAHNNSVKDAGRWYTLFNEAVKEKRDQISKEKVETEGLIKQAMLANEGSSIRIKLINEIISKYPNLLSSIKAEAITNDQLTASLIKLNAITKERYKMAAFEAKKEATEKMAIEGSSRLIEIEEELRQYRENTTLDDGVKERGMRLLIEESERIEKQLDVWQKQISNYASAAQSINDNIDAQYGTTIESLSKRRKLIEDEIAKMRSQLQQAILPQQKDNLSTNIGAKQQELDNIDLLLAGKDQKASGITTITTDTGVTGTGGKVDPADKKAMKAAKKAEQKAWDDLEKQLDKELDDADKAGTGMDAETLKMKEGKSETDALYQEQLDLANRLRDLHFQQTEEERIEEEKRIEFKRRAMEIKQQLEEQSLSAVSQSLDNLSSLFAENTAAYKITASLKAVVDTYMAANVALASAPPPFNYILMATTIATGLANVAKINAIQFAEGRYPVMGASDGRTYQAGYQPRATTGLYSRPTLVGGLGLVGERGSEIVISHPHVRHLQMNYPEVIRTIYSTATRAPQFAAGNYPAQPRGMAAEARKNATSGKEDVMIALMSEMVQQLKKPTRAYMTYNDLNDTVNEVNDIEQSIQ